MNLISKIKKSRDNWKQKAKERAESLRYQLKENFRVKKEREHYKKLAREANRQLIKERQKNIPVCNKEELVHISLNLFLTARISFRAVSRVLGVLGDKLGISKAPCPQTVINWVTRLSIARVKKSVQPKVPQVPGDRFSNGHIWMIDVSIGPGAGKILALLALNAHHHAFNEGAPTIDQVQCIGVSVAPSRTGESIADFLQRVISVKGRPAAYLKDAGTDLAGSLRLLDERGISSPAIDDVSHVSANLLKHEYKNHQMFNTFISACGKASKNLKQTLLACLAPPKVSTKARFMNLHRLVKWAEQLLRHSPKGRASKKSVLSKLRASIGNIPKCRPFIKRFLRDANPLLECQKILKNKGLNQDTHEQCKELLKTVPPRSNVRKGFTAWAEKQLKVAEELGLGKTGMPISSDTIESVFGVAKHHGTGTIKDANHIARRIPALTGKVTKEDARQVLSISVKEQHEVVGSFPSLTKQRRDTLPNPGNIENLPASGKKQYSELIPGAKKRLKNLINIDFLKPYGNSNGPPVVSEEQDKLLMEASVCMA